MAILHDLDLLRSRSRDATRNNGWIKKGINSWVSNEIGTGSLARDEAFRESIGEPAASVIPPMTPTAGSTSTATTGRPLC